MEINNNLVLPKNHINYIALEFAKSILSNISVDYLNNLINVNDSRIKYEDFIIEKSFTLASKFLSKCEKDYENITINKLLEVIESQKKTFDSLLNKIKLTNIASSLETNN